MNVDCKQRYLFSASGGETDRRDFKGYWDDTPASPWPGGAQLAVSFVVNVEEGAERSVGDGDTTNESVYESVEEVKGHVDPCMESHFGYGPRAGYRRIIEVLERYGVCATFSTCGRAAQRLPWLMQDIVARGHEVSCHGWTWKTHAGLSKSDERQIIAQTHKQLTQSTGIAPVGWHTRSASTAHTRELLLEHGGFMYDSDAYDDDLPRIEVHGDNHHVVLPYAFDTNDMRFQPGGSFVFAEDFSRYCSSAFDQLWFEGQTQARMMSVGLHLRTIGKPARITGLETLLKHMTSRENVWFASRQQIAACWREAVGLPSFPVNTD